MYTRMLREQTKGSSKVVECCTEFGLITYKVHLSFAAYQ